MEISTSNLFDTNSDIDVKEDYTNFFTFELYENAYNSIEEKDRMKIVIPSYNNFNSSTLHLLETSKLKWPIDVIVRKSQEEKYKNLYPIANIIGIEDELINSGTKAKKYIFENYSGNIFQFDDDLEKISFCYPGYTDKGKLKTYIQKYTDPIKIIAMWQLIHMKIIENFNFCWSTTPSRDLYVWSYDITSTNIDLAVNSPPSSIFAVNLDILKSNDVHMDEEISADDICTYWLALDKGLWPAQIKLISCELGKPRLEHYGKGCNTLQERFKMQSDELFAKYSFPWSKRKNHKSFGEFYATDTGVMRKHLLTLGTYPIISKIDYNKLVRGEL